MSRFALPRSGASGHLRLSLVVRGGVEPPTFRFSGGRSYQLSYLTVPGIRIPEGPDARLSGPDGI